MKIEPQIRQERLALNGRIIRAMSLEILVAAYRYEVNEQRRIARIPDQHIEIVLELNEHVDCAELALQELKSRGLPMAVSLRAASAWHQSDADWAETQHQVEQWANSKQPAVPPQSPKDGPVPPGEFRINGKTFKVTPQYYRILSALWKAEDKKMRRDKLIEAAWAKKDVNTHTVDTAIKRVNKVLLTAKANIDIRKNGLYFLLE